MFQSRFLVWLFCLWVLSLSAVAHTPDVDAPPIPDGSAVQAPLGLQQAQALALESQPLLEAWSAQARSAAARSVAAAELPDPSLHLNLSNLALDAPDPWAEDAERMTMTQIGISQRFVRSEKRQLAAELQRQESQLRAQQRALLARDIRRQVGQAWVQAWTAEQLRALREREVQLAKLWLAQSNIAVSSAQAGQTTQYQAQRRLALSQAAAESARAQLKVARAQLGRWLGQRADAPVTDPPQLPDAPNLARILDALSDLPQIKIAALQQQMQDTRLSQADAGRQPDWWVQTMYGYRRPFGDMISIGVGMDLPVFQDRRQDQAVVAASADRQAAEWRLQDLHSVLAAEIRSQHAQLVEAIQRTRWIKGALADARAAVATAEQQYAAGTLEMGGLLMQRDEALRTEAQWIEQYAQSLQRWLSLQALDARDALEASK